MLKVRSIGHDSKIPKILNFLETQGQIRQFFHSLILFFGPKPSFCREFVHYSVLNTEKSIFCREIKFKNFKLYKSDTNCLICPVTSRKFKIFRFLSVVSNKAHFQNFSETPNEPVVLYPTSKKNAFLNRLDREAVRASRCMCRSQKTKKTR